MPSRYLVRDDQREPSKMVDGAMTDRLAKSGVIGKIIEIDGDPLTGSATVTDTIGNSTQSDDRAVARVREMLARRARRRVLPGARSNTVSRLISGGAG